MVYQLSTLLKSSYTVYMVYIERAPSRSSTMVMTLHIMEKFNINYSKKNVPAASRAQYKLTLTSKIEKVIKRMRWKVLEFLGKLDSNSNNNETYGFKCLKYPPQLKKWRNSKMIYCYWLRTSNLRRCIMSSRWGCVMTSKRLKLVTRCLFQPINCDIFTKWKKMNTRNCYETIVPTGQSIEYHR